MFYTHYESWVSRAFHTNSIFQSRQRRVRVKISPACHWGKPLIVLKDVSVLITKTSSSDSLHRGIALQQASLFIQSHWDYASCVKLQLALCCQNITAYIVFHGSVFPWRNLQNHFKNTVGNPVRVYLWYHTKCHFIWYQIKHNTNW